MNNRNNIKLVAMDLDGTLTQHRSGLEAETRATLCELMRRYRLVMICAGGCERVYRQMGSFPIDILGFYGMEASSGTNGGFTSIKSENTPIDRQNITQRVELLRETLGLTEYAGSTVEFHASGVITFPLLGTAARLEEKLRFDPDRAKRRKIYAHVKDVFSDYNVFIGGSSSFDLVPRPFCKLYALDRFIESAGVLRDEVVYFGDDYGPGGNDEDIYRSGINFICIDDYKNFPPVAAGLLLT